MILYFSSTGNCRHIADILAKKFGDTAMSILETDAIHLKAGEKLGFVFPTYFWRLPSIVDEYMKKLTITAEDNQPYIYFIATYGTTCGQTGTFMKKHLKAKGYALSACYSVKTVDNWTVFFDVSDKGKIQQLLAAENAQTEEIMAYISNGEKGSRMKDTLPMIAVGGASICYNVLRKTAHLHVEDSCIGCGLCERECPVGAIKMQDGKPVWIKKSCTMCLGCLHSCPKFSIQCRNFTKKHGQYKHP